MRALAAQLWARRRLLPHLLVPTLPYLLLGAVIPVEVLMTRHGNDLNLYFDVSRRMLGGELPYRDIPLEYPPLSLPAFLLPRVVFSDPTMSVGHYVVLFAIQNALLVLVASVALVRLAARWRPRRRVTFTLAAWAILVIVSGPIVPWRYDLLPAVLSLLGMLSALQGAPLAAGVLLGLGRRQSSIRRCCCRCCCSATSPFASAAARSPRPPASRPRPSYRWFRSSLPTAHRRSDS